MENETDVLEFDFPDYEEPYPPFPDVKVALFDKEDSYSRNRVIADQLYADRQKEEEQRREDTRRTELKKMERLNPAALRPKSRAAKVVPIIAAVFAITAMVATSLTSGGMTNSESYAESETAAAIVEIVQTSAAETEYVPPEPFDENTYSIDDAVVYSTGTMSYLFLPYHTWDGKIMVNVTVRNLTEDKYKVMTKGFYLTDGENRSYDHVTISYQRTAGSVYSYYYAETRDITELNFDDSGECRFELEVPMDWLEKDSRIYIGYDNSYLSDFPEENVIEDFETPIYYYHVSN